MPNALNHLPINWVNGMKISKEHLVGQDNSNQNQLYNGLESMLSDVNFGLLQSSDPHSEPFEIELNDEWIRLRRCQAILRSGMRVDISEYDRIEALQQPTSMVFNEVSGSSAEWYVVLKIDPYKRQPFGEPNSEEFPVRHPHVIPSYRIGVVPKDELNMMYFDRNAIPLAKIRGMSMDRGYIPPCTNLLCSRALWERYLDYQKIMNSLELNLSEIRKKTIEKNKSSADQLSNDALELASSLLDFITFNKANFRMILPYVSPIYTVSYFSTMGGVFYDALRKAKEKDNLLKYFTHWINTYTPAELQGVVERVQGIAYNHLDLQESLKIIDSFLDTFQNIFDKLKTLEFRNIWDPKGVIDPTRDRSTEFNRPTITTNRSTIISPKNNPDGSKGSWHD